MRARKKPAPPALRAAVEKPPYRVPSLEEIQGMRGKNGLTVASTFSGAGGSCLGYEMAGYEVMWANEFQPSAIASYKANHPGVFVNTNDIRTVTAADILRETGGRVPDLFDGSPPCQSFSTAGKRQKSWGKVVVHGDGTTQRSDDLFFEYARIVQDLQPRAFIAENVAGLVAGAAKGYFLKILARLKAAGYFVEVRLLDAQWLGVPQTRRRVIFQGIRQDLYDKGVRPAWPKPFQYRYTVRDACPWINGAFHAEGGEWGRGDFTNAPSPCVTVGVNSLNSTHFGVTEKPRVWNRGADGFHGFEGEGEPADARPSPTITTGTDQLAISGPVEAHPPGVDEIDRAIVPARENLVKRWRELKLGEHGNARGVARHKASGKSGAPPSTAFSLVKVHPGAPAPAVTAMGGAPGMFAPMHPYEPRKFTILEAKRLCSFPDDFRLAGKYEERWARLGNSVPPLMMRAISAALAEVLLAAPR